MFAYRHAFHAGNHADVLKHLVLSQVLRYMAEKDKPFTLVDTHAGAGGYSLEGDYAHQGDEFATGIGALWARKDLPPAVADYVALVRAFNPGAKKLTQYPGSPGIANALLRADDRLRLYELHPTDHKILEAYLRERPQTQVFHSDGFASLKSELPPPSRRGVLLIDPSYEIKLDYARVVGALREALTRFPQCVVVIWYPQLQMLESAQLPQRLRNAAEAAAAPAKKGWLHVRLSVAKADERGFGLVGSGLFIANPPHTLHDELQALLPWLVEVLGQHDGASFLLEQSKVG